MKAFNLKEYLKNPSRKVVTRDGRNVTIHCTNCAGFRPVIAEIEGEDYSLDFNKNGIHYCGVSNDDLFFAPEKHERWVNVYSYFKNNIFSDTCIYNSKEEAEEIGKKSPYYITTVKIEWEE